MQNPTCKIIAAALAGLALLLALTMAVRSEAQQVIGAEHYSGFLRGDGYGWHGSTVTGPGPLRITWTPPEIMLTWPNTGMLQSASSILGPWNDHADAASPCTFPITNSQT